MIRLLVSLLVLFSFHVSALKVENGENCSQSALLNTTLLVVGMGLYCHAVLKKNKKQMFIWLFKSNFLVVGTELFIYVVKIVLF